MPYSIDYKGPGWYDIDLKLTKAESRDSAREQVYIDHNPEGFEEFTTSYNSIILVAN